MLAGVWKIINYKNVPPRRILLLTQNTAAASTPGIYMYENLSQTGLL